jgi:phosphohistidine phosphatase
MSGIIWHRKSTKMKTLYILRHAKSSWDDHALPDFERPLNERGRRAAAFMGSRLKDRKLLPDVIVCSPAKRAVETTKSVIRSSGFDGKKMIDERIYEASPQRLAEVARGIDDKYASAMIVGHNPGMEGLIYLLTDEMQPMPTAALAVIKLNIDNWAGTDAGCGSVQIVIRPKDEMEKR